MSKRGYRDAHARAALGICSTIEQVAGSNSRPLGPELVGEKKTLSYLVDSVRFHGLPFASRRFQTPPSTSILVFYALEVHRNDGNTRSASNLTTRFEAILFSQTLPSLWELTRYIPGA